MRTLRLSSFTRTHGVERHVFDLGDLWLVVETLKERCFGGLPRPALTVLADGMAAAPSAVLEHTSVEAGESGEGRKEAFEAAGPVVEVRSSRLALRVAREGPHGGTSLLVSAHWVTRPGGDHDRSVPVTLGAVHTVLKLAPWAPHSSSFDPAGTARVSIRYDVPRVSHPDRFPDLVDLASDPRHPRQRRREAGLALWGRFMVASAFPLGHDGFPDRDITAISRRQTSGRLVERCLDTSLPDPVRADAVTALGSCLTVGDPALWDSHETAVQTLHRLENDDSQEVRTAVQLALRQVAQAGLDRTATRLPGPAIRLYRSGRLRVEVAQSDDSVLQVLPAVVTVADPRFAYPTGTNYAPDGQILFLPLGAATDGGQEWHGFGGAMQGLQVNDRPQFDGRSIPVDLLPRLAAGQMAESIRLASPDTRDVWLRLAAHPATPTELAHLIDDTVEGSR